MDQSLNAGVEIEDIVDTNQPREEQLADVVFENPQNGFTPELDESVTIISDLSKKHDRVETIQEDMNRTQTMDQSTALEVHYATESFITDQRPLKMYTEFPTRTGYTYAMEALDGEKKNIIMRLWEKIKAFIVKALQWLGGLVKRAPNSLDEKEVNEYFGKYFDKNLKAEKGVLLVTKRGEDFFSRLNDILERKGVEKAVQENISVFGQKILEQFQKRDESFEALRISITESPTALLLLNNKDYFSELTKLADIVDKFTVGLHAIARETSDVEGFSESLTFNLQQAKEFSDGLRSEIAPIKAAVEEISARLAKIYQNKNGGRFAAEGSNYTIEDLMEDGRYIHSQRMTSAVVQLERSNWGMDGMQKSFTDVISSLDNLVNKYEEARQKTAANGEEGQVVEIIHGVFRELFMVLSEGSQQVMRFQSEVAKAFVNADKLLNAAISFTMRVNTYVKHMVDAVPEGAREQVQEYFEGVGFRV